MPRSIVAEGGFGPTWHEQEVADQIGERQSVVLLGEPTDGKTRTLYDIVHRLPDHHVVVPIIDQPTPEPDAFKILAGRRVILMLDNLTDFVDAAVDLTTFCNRLGSVADYVVVATCRDGPEQRRVRDGFRGGLRTLYERIPLKLRLEPLNADDKRTLAESADIDWDPAREALYPTPGSIIMADALSAMTGRFDQLAIGPRTVVLAITLLDYAGIAPVTRKRVAAVVCDVFGQAVNLDDGLNQLADSSFIGKPANRDPILPEPAYIRPPVVNYAEHRTGGPRGDFDALADSLSTHSDAAGLFYLSTVLDSKTEHDRLRIVNCLDKSLAIDPNIPEALYNKGAALDNLGRYEEAITAYDAALALRTDPEALNNKGVALDNLGRYEEAITAYDAALALRAEYPEALNNKGVALRNLGRHEEAITAYDAALALRTDPEALNNKGVALDNLGRHEEAITAYDAALALRAEYPEALNNKGVALDNLGRYEEAITAYDAALALRAEYPEALNNKGAALDNLGRHEEAITAYDAALALRTDPEALNNKGAALGNLGRHEGAITAYDAALALRTDPEALYNKGVALGNLGRYEEAIIYFDKVLELRSDMPQVFCNKAVAFELLGRLDDANNCFATAAELGFDCGRGGDGSSASSVSTDR
ncbi:MAG: tetratricopeptide repeat protein [Thermomicrobiales bacterium]